MMNSKRNQSSSSFLLMLIVVATAVVHQGNAKSSVTAALRSSSSSTKNNMTTTNVDSDFRKLNFFEDMWNNFMGEPGSGSVSGEFVPGMYDDLDNNDGTNEWNGIDGNGGGELYNPDNNFDFGDFGNNVNWGEDGAWEDFLTSFMNDGGLDSLLNGEGGFDLSGFDLDGLLGNLGGLDFENMDFGQILGGNGENGGGVGGGFMDMIGGLFGGNGDGSSGNIGGFDLSVCSIVEMAIGMSPQFGVEANCKCVGDFQSGFDIDCNFEQCAASSSELPPGSSELSLLNDSNGNGECGTMNLDFDFGGPDGIIKANACADLANDDLEETCFSYEIDMRNNGDGNNNSSCEATYGGNQCECTMDGNFCMSIDCTPFLEGGKMDTCQMLSMIDADDVAGWFPNFDAFLPEFEGGGFEGIGNIIDGVGGNNGLPPALDELLPPSGDAGEWEEVVGEWEEEEDSEEDNNDVWIGNSEDEDNEDEDERVDVTIPARPAEPIDGDLVVLQASEMVYSGVDGRYSGSLFGFSTGIAATAAGFVIAILFN